MAAANYDPHLGAGPSEDSEIFLDDSDSGSVLSDDSVLPDYDTDDNPTEPANTLYEACAKNDAKSLRRILERGVTKDEAMELDINGRVRWILLLLDKASENYVYSNKAQCKGGTQKKCTFASLQNGLMVAVGKGFIDIVTKLHVCPLIDINHQDNDGNTALMIAAQAGMSSKYTHHIQP